MVSSVFAKRLTDAAESAARYRRAASTDPQLSRLVHIVKSWQSQRLARSHADLLASDRYRAAALFFVNDLYGSGEHSRRDAELARVIPTLNRFLPEAALGTICDAVELDALSESLDHRVAEQLQLLERSTGRAFEAQRFDPEAYGAAYHAAGSFHERDRQIEAVSHIGESLDKLVRKPMVFGLLKTMGGPARAAGLGAMHEFLVRGFQAFKAMGGARDFLQTVLSREKALAAALERADSSALPN